MQTALEDCLALNECLIFSYEFGLAHDYRHAFFVCIPGVNDIQIGVSIYTYQIGDDPCECRYEAIV